MHIYKVCQITKSKEQTNKHPDIQPNIQPNIQPHIHQHTHTYKYIYNTVSLMTKLNKQTNT